MDINRAEKARSILKSSYRDYFAGWAYALLEFYTLILDNSLNKLPFINVAVVGGSDRELEWQVINLMGFS